MAEIAAVIGTGAGTTAAASGAAEPTASHYLALNNLNKASAKMATFICRVSRPKQESYSYRRKSGAGMQTQHKFQCLLLGAPDDAGPATSCYAMGVAKADLSSVDAMARKWPEGTIIKISKVTFEGTVGATSSTRRCRW